MADYELPAYIRQALEQPLPGIDAHYEMLSYRPGAENNYAPPPDARLGATLMLLYPREDQLHFVLMQRPEYGGAHSSQVSFPGGKKEEEDDSMLQTALRETEEETGFHRGGIEVIGKLSEIYIPPSRFHVHPFVGFTPDTPQFSPDAREVVELIEVPLEELLDPSSVSTSKVYIQSANIYLDTPCFMLQDRVVWGMTCAVLNEFKRLIV